MKIMETVRLTLSNILLAVLDDRLISWGKWQNCCHLGNLNLEWKNTDLVADSNSAVAKTWSQTHLFSISISFLSWDVAILEDKACSVIVLDHLSICVCVIYKASCISSEDNFTDLCSCTVSFFFFFVLSATHLHSIFWSFVLFLTYESHAYDYNVDPQICGNAHENDTT